MTKSTVAVLSLAAALAGCATDKPLLQQASEAATNARTAAANFIAPKPGTNNSNNATGTSGAGATVVKKTVGVTFDKAYDGKVSTNAVVAAGRGVAAKFTSLNGEYVAITIKDSNKNSKVEPVTKTGLIALESCSQTVAGTVATAAPALFDRGAAILGRAGAAALPSAAGPVGNVLRTQTQRTAVESGNAAKTQILSGATTLTQEQQVACKADMGTVATEIKAYASDTLKDFSAVNKGAKPVVTYTGTGDLKDLQLGLPTRAPGVK